VLTTAGRTSMAELWAFCAAAVLCPQFWRPVGARLGDRPGDLQIDRLLVRPSQFTRDVICLPDELGSATELCRLLVELHRIGYQFAASPLGVGGFGDEPVRPSLGWLLPTTSPRVTFN
jgi:hypothetical protein